MDLASIQRAYRRYAKLYDKSFGVALHPGRKLAVRVANSRPDQRVLEVGVGTGLSLPLYRPDARITGIDVSKEMLAIARTRVIEEGLANVEALVDMDAENLTFEDNSFDAVVAMYVASVVPNPKRLIREMRRVCVPGGAIMIVNHFTSRGGVMRAVEKGLSGLSRHLGWRPEFDMEPLLHEAGLEVLEIRRANPIGLFTMIHCRNVPDPGQTVSAAAAARRGAMLPRTVHLHPGASD
jgi:phosphatidylethanolamine/phosphatidyl-N-methylethanolamine N-methyltransferase